MSNSLTIKRGMITVRLLSIQQRAFDEVVAAARTCYSAIGLVDMNSAAAWPKDQRNALASSLFDAGHHTTLQHSHATFAIEGVTRQAIWTFLHSHPFYNSEQVSQRYVAVSRDAVTVPESLNPGQKELFVHTVETQMDSYRSLCKALIREMEEEYLAVFPGREGTTRAARDIERRAQEAARYVLPLATHACLHHTVSVLTLMRYHKLMLQPDAPMEQRDLAEAMIELLLRVEPDFAPLLKEPIGTEDFRSMVTLEEHGGLVNTARAKKFTAEFDAGFGDFRLSRLVDWGERNEQLLADSLREVMGIPSGSMSDEEAINIAINPGYNKIYAETLNLSTMAKLGRTLWHPHYTFRKKLSHCADSQDQRHRMTPASRPLLMSHYTGEPDVVVPDSVKKNSAALRIFDEANARTWEAANRLLANGASPEAVCSLLPNCLSVRFTQSADLLNLRHKMAMRLCYNAQEEIRNASYEEAAQIMEINPNIGRHLVPPCVNRMRGGIMPPCPEGDRFCGMKPWAE